MRSGADVSRPPSPIAEAAYKRLREDFRFYVRKCLVIRSEAGIVPLKLNAVQRYVHARLEEQLAASGRVRALILKARQPGISTYVEARFFHRVTMAKGLRAFILTHSDTATSNLFGMAKRYYDGAPAPVKPSATANNANQLDFGKLDSSYRVATAKAAGVGRSDTIQLFHGSEVAFWDRASEHAMGALQAVPNAPGTEIILESTARGMGGLFYDLCMAAEAGRGEYQLIFIPWHMHEKYREAPPVNWRAPPAFLELQELHALTDEQIFWAWQKNEQMAIASGDPSDEPCWKFNQEYPTTAQDAFVADDARAFISSELVMRARKADVGRQDHAPMILGVDVARGGADESWIIDRQGRSAGRNINERIDTSDTMEIVARVARIIDGYRVAACFIDVNGVGAGVYDRLVELGYKRQVMAVHFGGKAINGRDFRNKRAEMYGGLKEWLGMEGGVSIPDQEILHRHIVASGYKLDSADRLQIESKEDIKRRVNFSPDGADALALTFAFPVSTQARQDRRPRHAVTEYAISDHGVGRDVPQMPHERGWV